MTKGDTENIGMPLTGELLQMLKWVMQHRGIHNKTEMVRVLIREEYTRRRATVALPQSTLHAIHAAIRRSGQTVTPAEFIEDAVRWFVDEKRTRE